MESDLLLFVKKKVRTLRFKALRASSRLLPLDRKLPTFLIIGAQKCGTTTFFRLLQQHPLIATSLIKEVHYFDHQFHRQSECWYRSFFPTEVYARWIEKRFHTPLRICEASPYYNFHPSVAERVHTLLPGAKFILLLRNPIDRAYSHYFHNVRKGQETVSFEEALRLEDHRLAGETKKIKNDPTYQSLKHVRYSLKERGKYIEQIDSWLQYFSRDQLLILKSEDFYRDPIGAANEACTFIDLPAYRFSFTEVFNRGEYPQMQTETRQRLSEFFRPYNQALFDFLDQDLGWD